ncbi:MAG: hypothetical protein AAFY41_14465, partial [Bacteroidota bacterium]
PGSLTNVCTADGFQAIGDIQITETGTGDFGSSGTILLTLPAGFEFNTEASAVPTSGVGSNFIDITVAYAFIGTATLQLTITYDGSDDGLDDVIIQGLQVQAVAGGVSGNLERAGGTANLLTTDTNYATLSSNSSPAGISDVEVDGITSTEHIAKFLPVFDILFTADPGFTDGEELEFSGGATGIMVPASQTGTSLQVYITSGEVDAGETINGVASSVSTSVNSASFTNNKVLLPFTTTADPSGDQVVWYLDNGTMLNTIDVTAGGTDPDQLDATNTELGATDAGLYSYFISVDNGTCESDLFEYEVLVYDDVDPVTGQVSFENRSYLVSDDSDTIYFSNPTDHTVNISGNGLSVIGGGSDPILAIFDPGIAGAGGEQNHIITYTITNDDTGSSRSETVTFTVEPETSIWAGPPADEYCS